LKSTETRFWEVDVLRAVAIMLMVIFHLVYDLVHFGGYGITVAGGPWYWVGRICAVMFIVLVGVSLSIGYAKDEKAKVPFTQQFLRHFKRGSFVFFWGMAITMVAWFFVSDGQILFGILHLIGFSIILAFPLLPFKYTNLIFGILCIAAGLYLQDRSFEFSWLFWLGLKPEVYHYLDYYPVLPWFGAVLTGVFIGNVFYCGDGRRFKLPDLSRFIPVRVLCFFGRHSLIIYLIHQPLIVMILVLTGVISFGDIG
jgi:uncharacterized membrane protein